MPALTLRNCNTDIRLVQALETSKKTLAELIYTPGLANAVLEANGMAARQILEVTPDLESTTVNIAFYAYDDSRHCKTVPCEAFLEPFRLRRALRSGAYKLASINPQQADQLTALARWLPLAPEATITAVYENKHRPAHLVVCEATADGQTRYPVHALTLKRN
ncbi:hypothetical protein H6F86_25630 [Phormidium sp. FACHB-592]|uniref:Uncharacterized protein n=1 Tax=Stenomitos frigidus AS-A4 TaxID=2933935 RepID=A0ABV0KSA3_9CYAN|nr:hypothetical protein [Phormidium sp. FACHB-592]MBD2077200.1 hypothetical protein [Phormidium sp. FACHB-592]